MEPDALLLPGVGGDVLGRAPLDEVRRHVHALVALSRVLDLVGDDLLDGALLEVRVAPRGAHGREGLVQVGPDLAARAGRAERVATGAPRGEERLPVLRVPTRRDASGAAAGGKKCDAGEGGEREPHAEAPLAGPPPGRAGFPRVRLKRPVGRLVSRQRPPKQAGGSTTGSARGPRPATGRS